MTKNEIEEYFTAGLENVRLVDINKSDDDYLINVEYYDVNDVGTIHAAEITVNKEKIDNWNIDHNNTVIGQLLCYYKQSNIMEKIQRFHRVWNIYMAVDRLVEIL